MAKGLSVKVCGLTRHDDVQLLADLGADYFGFILYEKSPRCVDRTQLASLLQTVSRGQRVVVDVAPKDDDLRAHVDCGFDYFQLHAAIDTPATQLEQWAKIVGPERLCLAPILPPAAELPAYFMEVSHRILLDTYKKNQVGGTGHVNDWGRFYQLQTRHQQVEWILAGGLNPMNLSAAIKKSGAGHVDVNSGVETAPGCKDPSQLVALFQQVELCRQAKRNDAW